MITFVAWNGEESNMSDFEYQLLDKEKKLEIIDRQLLELEVKI